MYNKHVTNKQVDSCKFLSGFAASVFQLEHELNSIKARLPDLQLKISARDQTRLFYSDRPEMDNTHQMPFRIEFERIYKFSVANQ